MSSYNLSDTESFIRNSNDLVVEYAAFDTQCLYRLLSCGCCCERFAASKALRKRIGQSQSANLVAGDPLQ